ncbi:hypothetical protein HYV64_02370 [Candidatus Shapirobacteria bacterium]|nr:hypothetical protein [Candidatus Shapirobacteria bacterium]
MKTRLGLKWWHIVLGLAVALLASTINNGDHRPAISPTAMPVATEAPKLIYQHGESKFSTKGQEAFILKNLETGVSVLQVNPTIPGGLVLIVTSVTEFFWSPDGVHIVYLLYGEEVWMREVATQDDNTSGWISEFTGYKVEKLADCRFYQDETLYCVNSIIETP